MRLYRLGNYPPLNADEAAIGYNSWSLVQTGRDEHGESWPLHFKSFGDYKPGAYFYMVLPLVKFWGLSEWAVRLPSALMGIATVYLVFSLAKLVWQDERLGLIWAAVLSISPWHLHFSRGGWESNSALFFITLGTYCFFKFKSSKSTFHFSLFTFNFALAMYTYHSARLITPVLVLGLGFFNREFLLKEKKRLIKPLFLVVLFLIPLAFSFLRGGASARFSGVGLMADSGPLWRANELRGQYANPDAWLPTLLHNRYLLYSISFFQKYFSHFNGEFLFISGDLVPRSKLPDMGVMHFVEVGLLVVGIYCWLRSKKKEKYLIGLWLLVAPLASAMTFQAPSALRSLSLVIPLTFFVAFGIQGILNSKIHSSVFVILICYLWCFCYWQNQYFVHYLKRYPSAWPNFKPVAKWLKEEGDQHDKICIMGQFDQPYILTLFYLQYPPEKIQKEIELTPPDEFGFSTVKQFGKYTFGDCEGFNGKILY